ncbi:MAG TPA: phage tail family protein [Bellilinea sp.]|nr:phage tail family protein [Bellilinea sp.]
MMKIVEKIEYTTPDGKTFSFHNPPSRAVTEITGWGEPVKNFDTARGAYQHGEFVLAAWLQPRDISFGFRYQGTSRDAYWEMRERLNNLLRVSRSDILNPVPGTLTRTLSNGQRRSLTVVLESGLAYNPPAQSSWDEWSIFEILHFTAHDPVIFDPSGYSMAPLTGFNAQATQTRTIQYLGTWPEYPTLKITGPTNGATITILETGYTLKLDYNIAAGEVVTIDMRYGKKTFISSTTGIVSGYIDIPNSDVGLWALQPDPIVPDGVNRLQVSTNSASSATKVEMDYYLRYESI